MNGRIIYDPNLVIMSETNDNSNMSINPTYSTGVLALYYSPFSDSVSETTFYIKATAQEVTETTVATFTIKYIEVTTLEQETADLDDVTVSVTINPSSSEIATVASTSNTESVAGGTTSTTSGTSNTTNSTKDSSTVTTNELAQTGENDTILFIIGGLIIMGILGIVKFKKLKKILLEILPIFVFGIIFMTCNKTEAETYTLNSAGLDQIVLGVYNDDNDEQVVEEIVSTSDTDSYDYMVKCSYKIIDINGTTTNLITLNVSGGFDTKEDSLTSDVIQCFFDAQNENHIGYTIFTDIECESDSLYTGTQVTCKLGTTNDDTEDVTTTCTILIYGDGDGDGKIAGTEDLKIIIDEYLYGTYSYTDTTEGYKTLELYAMDIFYQGSSAQKKLNVFDVKRLIDLANHFMSEDSYIKDPDDNSDSENVGIITIELDEYTGILGDVNDDGTVNLSDLVHLTRYFAGVEKLSDSGLLNSDVYDDGTGTIDSMDLYILRRYMVSIYTKLPVTPDEL